ncbi:PAS domain-containing sensor histidine kinase [Fundidesulfovibrio terrae]|uniref:PAS domain-containing sensor histidine kinase n=1 Tax=Fundidesulfovibrio terrae TaxID=2922866 RepID=UPI001FAFCE10|nr:PAS domain S-box protein [Fundidesulfovibrio terrae]
MSGASLQASVLGQLLLVPSLANALPDETSLFAFVCEKLKDIPGVKEVLIVPDGAGDAYGAEPESELLALRDGKVQWGRLLFRLSDPAAFSPYRAYLESLCQVLAVMLEARAQRWRMEAREAWLEERIQVRNLQLTEQAAARRQTEKALGESRMMLEYILDAVPQSIFWKDRDSVYLGCNQAFASAAGVEHPAAITGMTDYDLPWLREESDAYRRDDKEVMEHNRPKLHIVEQQLPADGERRWVETSKIPLVDEKGEVMGVLGIYSDITERKLAEEALRESEAKYRRLHESIMDGYARVTMDGSIMESNPSFQVMTGYGAEELGHLTYKDLTPEKWHAFEGDILSKQVLVRGYSEVYEKEYRRRDGTIIPVELRTYLVRGADGEPEGMWSVVRDVTERKHMLDAMIQNEKMMSVGGLAAGMAHEINNPLSGIIQGTQVVINRLNVDTRGNLEAARECGIDPESLRSYLHKREIPEMVESIRESAVRAARIVANMLEFSRKSDSAKIPVDLNALLDKSVELSSTDYDLKKKFDFRRIVIHREYDPNLPQVPCSALQIQQVFLNLLRNAAQAMEGRSPEAPPPAITLRTKLEGDKVRIEVEDNGSGLDDCTRRKIFEPFFTTKSVGRGTGLGLSISYFIIVNNHRGSIEVESCPGLGSRFVVKLPLGTSASPRTCS